MRKPLYSYTIEFSKFRTTPASIFKQLNVALLLYEVWVQIFSDFNH